MAIPEIENRIMEIFSDSLYLNLASPYVDLIETGVLDSMMLMELTMLLEKNFDIRISVSEIRVEDITSVSAISAFVTRLMRKAQTV